MKLRNKYSLLVVAIAAAYPLAGHGAAGVAQFTSGDVTVRRGAGTDTLTKGKNVESGDAIVTGANGRAQVRFTDGGLVALAPNSQFNITRYADANDPKQDSFLVDLLRGGMRAVTGLIGKRNRDNYKVTTQTATIGIRGSAFELSYAPDGTLLVSTQMDEIEVCTRAGCVGLTAGESARVTSNDALAIRTNARTSIVTPPPRQLPEVASNQVDAEGKPTIVAGPAPAPQPPAPKGPKVYTGMAISFAGLRPVAPPSTETLSALSAEGNIVSGVFAGALQTDVNGQPEQFQSTNNTNLLRDGTVTIVSETGTYEAGDLMVLGTWQKGIFTGPVTEIPAQAAPTSSETLSPFAFVTGVAAPTSALTQMAGMRGEYHLSSATDVFVDNGTKGTLLGTSKLGVEFIGQATANVDVYLDVLIPNGASGTSFTHEMRGSASAKEGIFDAYLSCSSTYCEGNAHGFFGGPEAKKIGLSYQGRSYDFESDTQDSFGGAAVFSQGTPEPLTPITYEQNFTGLFASHNGSYSAVFEATGYGTFLGTGLTKIGTGFGAEKGGSATMTNGATIEYTGDPIRPDAWGFVGWGYWSAGSSYAAGSVTDVHYVVGKPTSYLPYSGVATYTLVGGTTPTSSGAGAGQLMSASLSADFSTSIVSASATARFGSTDVTVSNNALSRSAASFSGSNASGDIKGFFSGYNAMLGGFVYSSNQGGALGTVSGAAVFRQSGLTYPGPY